jgi:hypothetical protein
MQFWPNTPKDVTSILLQMTCKKNIDAIDYIYIYIYIYIYNSNLNKVSIIHFENIFKMC